MATVLLFGALRDAAGWTRCEMEATTLGAVRAELRRSDPRLADRIDHRSTLVIVNHTALPPSARGDDVALTPDDEVAFGSPVSGG